MSANDMQVGGDHYQGGSVQHWDFAWEHGYNQFEYCITKYVSRCHKKGQPIEDLRKARHHLLKYIELTGKLIVMDNTRKRHPIALWCHDQQLDTYQSAINYYVHTGFLDEAHDAINSYLSRLQHDEMNPPREYITGGD